MKKQILISFFILALISCDINTNLGIRSGNLDDDNIEEPLSAHAKKYRLALNITNDIVEKLREEKYDKIYEKYASEEFKKQVNKEGFAQNFKNILSIFGRIESYKKMQWGFLPSEENGARYLTSFKVLKHEDQVSNLAITFYDDGKYNKFVSIKLAKREGARSPNSNI